MLYFRNVLWLNKYHIWAWLVCLVLGACGLFRKSHHGKKPVVTGPYFKDQPVPLLRKALCLHYEVADLNSVNRFDVYPGSENAYECDFVLGDKIGHLKVDDSAARFSRKYTNYFTADSNHLRSSSAVWLSRQNFTELQQQGWSVFDFGNDGIDTMHVDTVSNYYITFSQGDDNHEDTLTPIPVVMVRGKKPDRQIRFIADPNYPLIVDMYFGVEVSLGEVQMKETKYDTFEPGPGCILRYRILQNGNEEYNFTLTNVIWSDTLMRFGVKGDFYGSYDYEYDYVLEFRGKAISSPVFEIPHFSAIGGTMEEKVRNFVFLRASEMDAIRKQGKGYAMVSHFAPEFDGDSTGFTPAEIKEIKDNYRESYRTWFTLMHTGRLLHAPFGITDDETFEERLLPALNLQGQRGEVRVSVLDKGKYPLLLYYNDNFEYEMTLEYAGYDQ